jgi:hypothetical protein
MSHGWSAPFSCVQTWTASKFGGVCMDLNRLVADAILAFAAEAVVAQGTECNLDTRIALHRTTAEVGKLAHGFRFPERHSGSGEPMAA